MKNIKTIAFVTVLGLAACSSAFAQGRPGGAQQPPKDAAAAVAHITEAYSKIALFDVNIDGQLDENERLALGQAMRDGKIMGLANRPPNRNQAGPPDFIIQRIAGLYGIALPFDADQDDTLSEVEQVALKSAIEKGEVKLPRMGDGGPPFGVGGPPPGFGGRPF